MGDHILYSHLLLKNSPYELADVLAGIVCGNEHGRKHPLAATGGNLENVCRRRRGKKKDVTFLLDAENEGPVGRHHFKLAVPEAANVADS